MRLIGSVLKWSPTYAHVSFVGRAGGYGSVLKWSPIYAHVSFVGRLASWLARASSKHWKPWVPNSRVIYIYTSKNVRALQREKKKYQIYIYIMPVRCNGR
jgi:hypothetical protein